ncbi:hypothetical protein JR316_0008306 [Psilocybe cubensis]|uniref:Uncharacterized protein n=1 Tax=Psilocybe cubensis TaxID=181762 RepID=A0ACB8GWV7_PSICU|nr:hypothetical protein JR316_0008306 [Psilocybe cubensis]KAH9479711.1 hypothetical protein JR316_0008306 [Psilocybe cubensis]
MDGQTGTGFPGAGFPPPGGPAAPPLFMYPAGMMMVTPDILRALRGWTILTYLEVTAMTLFLYDYTLTFGMEYRLVWKKRSSVIKLLYIFQRYLPFCDVGFLTIYRHSSANLTGPQCHVLTVGTGILLTIRVWALWNRDAALTIALPIGFVSVWVPASVAGYFYIQGLIYPEVPLHPGFLGCVILKDNHMVIWCWLGLLIWDTICLILVAVPGVKSSVQSKAKQNNFIDVESKMQFEQVRCQGLNTSYIAMRSLSGKLSTVLSPACMLTRVFHSMLASRVLLELRQQTDNNHPSEFSPTEMDFDERLGAIDTATGHGFGFGFGRVGGDCECGVEGCGGGVGVGGAGGGGGGAGAGAAGGAGAGAGVGGGGGGGMARRNRGRSFDLDDLGA